MTSKLPGKEGTEGPGPHRRARVVLNVRRIEDLALVVDKPKSYPSPVRVVGADYSQTRCVGAEGTTIDAGALNKITEMGDCAVRVQAGVRLATLVRWLADRGLELPLTPEMGQISAGALAVTTLPQASFEPGLAQMSSCVSEIRMITPQGRHMIIGERDRELMRVLRSSFGLLGVVHEVVLRVRPAVPIRIDYHVMSLKEFAARHASLMQAPGAMRLHISPFADKITVERRTPEESGSLTRSGIWQIRNSVMRNVLPAFGSTVGSVLAAPGLRAAMQRALRATLDRSARAVVLYASEWMRELPADPNKARHTYSLWGFPQTDYPRLLGEYFKFCRAYHKQHRYRGNVVTGASRLHQDKGSLFSVSYAGPAMTLEPSSAGDAGWEDFLIDFNDFASSAGGVPTFNQSRGLQPEHVARAFGERLKLFRALRQRTDPNNRLRNSYFSHLIG